MSAKKLWTKLHSQNDEADEIAMHSSGAIVRHHHPFEEIEVPRNEERLSKEFLDKWVTPFYMHNLPNLHETVIKSFADTARNINTDTVKLLLGDFDWRSRITGAFFSAINNYTGLEDIIGSHLLKSEVCYAGSGYCLAFAAFKTMKAKEYLIKYLDYYLDRKDLWFDQADAFCALEYLDKEEANKRLDKWNSFVAGKQNWNLDRSREHFSSCISTIEKIREAKTND